MKSKQFSTLGGDKSSPVKDPNPKMPEKIEDKMKNHEIKDTEPCDITETSDHGNFTLGSSPNFGNGARKAIEEVQNSQKPVDAFIAEMINNN